MDYEKAYTKLLEELDDYFVARYIVFDPADIRASMDELVRFEIALDKFFEEEQKKGP